MFRRRYLARAVLCAGLLLALGAANAALDSDSGQRTFGEVVVEPAIDDSTGETIFLLSLGKIAVPAHANDEATAPLYLPLYPLSSKISTFDLNCQPTNCAHVNVLPFHFSGYDALPASSQACIDFNGGQECSLVKGHDHLVAVASTGGDVHATCAVQLVVFASKAFADGAINIRITTLKQISSLLASHDVIVVSTPVEVHCSETSERTYEHGTPVVIPFP